MGFLKSILKPVVAASFIYAAVGLPNAALAGNFDLDAMMEELQQANPEEAARIAADIQLQWGRSGSASADLLLKRGRDAMERGEVEAAIGHFTALVDHAPDFAEGWHARAGAYFFAGLLGPALGDLEQALTLNPQHYEAIAGLAAVFEMLDRPLEAYEAYRQVKSIHPHHPDVTEALERLEPLVKGQEL